MKSGVIMSVLHLRNIYKSYRTKHQAVTVLNDLNLEISKGEFVAIIGTSGQGKSTLLNIIGCLDRPDSGDYYLDGKLVNWNSKRHLAFVRGNKIATIFQNFELISHWTVLENVEISLRFQDVCKEDRVMRALHALRQVNLLQHSTKFPHELSGGEQQRCAIARVICSNPDVILADEPTGNLDPESAAIVMELLLAMNRQGKTIIFVTHDHQLAKLAHRIAILKAGHLEWWSDTNDQRQHT